MAWVRLDDLYADHQKVTEVGPLGSAMQVAAICYANRHLTDGFISYAVARKLLDFDGIAFICETPATAGDMQVTGFRAEYTAIVDKLVAAGMWVEVEGGWRIHDYLEYQKSKAEIAAKRADPEDVSARRREAGRRGGQAKAANASKRASTLPDVANDLPLANPGKILAKSSIPNPNPNPNPVPKPIPDPDPQESARARKIVPIRQIDGDGVVAGESWLGDCWGDFVGAYPGKKTFTDTTRALFDRHCADAAAFGRIMAGLAAWTDSEQWTEKGGRYITNPDKFLETRKYEDVPPDEAHVTEGTNGRTPQPGRRGGRHDAADEARRRVWAGDNDDPYWAEHAGVRKRQPRPPLAAPG